MSLACIIIELVIGFIIFGYVYDDKSTRSCSSKRCHDDDDDCRRGGRDDGDEWYRYTESERYSGHSYGESVSHICNEGATYGYNEKW